MGLLEGGVVMCSDSGDGFDGILGSNWGVDFEGDKYVEMGLVVQILCY